MSILLDTLSSLTVRDLQRQGLLVKGAICQGYLNWTTSRKEIVLTARVEVDEPSAFVRIDVGNSVQAVRLERCPSNLGIGHRFYFQSPATGFRSYKLYWYGGRFVSRLQIPSALYESQAEGKRYRVYRQYFQAEAKAFQIITRKGYTPSYKGKPTKAFLRYQKAVDRIGGLHLY